MTTKKKTVAKKKPVAKKVAKKVDVYDQITSKKVDGVLVYMYKDHTSINLDKIKRYVDSDLS